VSCQCSALQHLMTQLLKLPCLYSQMASGQRAYAGMTTGRSRARGQPAVAYLSEPFQGSSTKPELCKCRFLKRGCWLAQQFLCRMGCCFIHCLCWSVLQNEPTLVSFLTSALSPLMPAPTAAMKLAVMFDGTRPPWPQPQGGAEEGLRDLYLR
jgi:hypothetical protein